MRLEGVASGLVKLSKHFLLVLVDDNDGDMLVTMMCVG